MDLETYSSHSSYFSAGTNCASDRDCPNGRCNTERYGQTYWGFCECLTVVPGAKCEPTPSPERRHN